MAALLIAMLALMAVAATTGHSQTYPGPSQRIEPTQPMQSLQPIQPMAPLPAPPMTAPGDTPGTRPPAPQAGSSGGRAPTGPEPPAGRPDTQRDMPPADTQYR